METWKWIVGIIVVGVILYFVFTRVMPPSGAQTYSARYGTGRIEQE